MKQKQINLSSFNYKKKTFPFECDFDRCEKDIGGCVKATKL